MFKVLFLLFVIIPIIEIAVLMQVGAVLGVWTTLAIVIITAWLGAKNVRQQGITTLQSVQTKMAQGEMPSDEIMAGVLLLVSGVLLVTPGFVTDAFGLALLVPAVRAVLIRNLQHQLITKQTSSASFHHQSFSFNQENNGQNNPQNIHENTPNSRQGNVIDGEYERKN